MYRVPTGNFIYFINKLEVTINSLYSTNTQFVICHDLNINYIFENEKKNFDSLLSSYGLSITVYFQTRFQNSQATAIDNIFIDTSKFANYITFPPLNGLADDNAQHIIIYDTDLKLKKIKHYKYKDN
jgi:hypothetical protein